MSALKNLLDSYRLAAATEREKGTYFEELICATCVTKPATAICTVTFGCIVIGQNCRD